MAKIFANQVRIRRGPDNNQKDVLAIFDKDHKILWEAPRMPVATYFKIGSTGTTQYTFNTEEGKFNSGYMSLNHAFDHTKLIPQPCEAISSTWHPGTVEISGTTMTFKRWDERGSLVYTIPSTMQSFKPTAVWLAEDGWFYSDGNVQRKFNSLTSTFDVATHLDINGNSFTPDPSQMWMYKGVLHQGNNYKRIFDNDVHDWRWTSSGIQTISNFSAASIWTDGEDIFYGTTSKLNKTTLQWESFSMNIQVSVSSIWTDGRYLYANMTNGSPSTYLKWDRYNKKWIQISTTKLIYTISSMNYLWTDRQNNQTGAHGGYGFASPAVKAFTGFKLNGKNTTFTMQYKVWGV